MESFVSLNLTNNKIKKVLHEADKYEKYDEKELDIEFKEINDLLL